MKVQAPILVVEDDYNDVLLIRRAFRLAQIGNHIRFVRNGRSAIAYLSGIGRYANRDKYPMPSLVLLDLKMPGLDGFGVLEWIRQQSRFNTLRVVVLTSSDEIRDVNEAYQLGANSFLVKPLEFENIGALFSTLTAQRIHELTSP
ncbi:MAG TPA: response regulator [Candidatus Limnocylindrales bacterium]|jgi:CheY-like chemotaxis protein|nr:response regulator [Candidatus Limnocylindrales bacterium]